VIKNNQDSKLQALEAKSSSGHYFYYKSTESLSKLELMAVIALEIAHVHKNTSWNRLTKTPEKVAQSEFIQKTKEYSEEYRRHFESSYSADEIREAALHAQTLIEKSKLGPSGREVLAQWFKKLEEEQIQEAQKQSPYSRSYPGAAWQLEQIQ
jgi:CRISPR/Cas system-associated endonuclease Cas3-HD